MIDVAIDAPVPCAYDTATITVRLKQGDELLKLVETSQPQRHFKFF